MAQISAPAPEQFHFALQEDGFWEDLGGGVSRKCLAADESAHTATYLVRMAAGASFASHTHHATEHCYVISGDLYVAGRHLHDGDYHVAAAGSVHDTPRSDAGCLLLVIEAAELH
jgi:quercetin dioxygenase-like cupin family protein